MTGRASRRPAQALTRAASLAAVDDQALITDLLGLTAARRVEHLPVTALLDAGAAQLAQLGLTPAARRRLQAAAELARRFQPVAFPPVPALNRPKHFLPHLARLRAQPVEVFGILTLNARLVLLDDFCTVAGGALTHVSVAAREVFEPAIACRAAAIVLAHNHPSGDAAPSLEDRQFTQVMVEAGALLGIQVLDHLIVTRRAYFSFVEARLL
jgi:DNA repair protein RadC